MQPGRQLCVERNCRSHTTAKANVLFECFRAEGFASPQLVPAPRLQVILLMPQSTVSTETE